MRNTSFSLAITIIFLVTVACSKQTETDHCQETVTNSENVKSIVPLEDALDILYDFMAEVEPQSLPTRSGGKTIATIETFSFDTTSTRSGEGIPDAYVVNFSDDGGYAVLGANTSVTPIVAYTESGSIDLSKTLEDSEEEFTPEDIKQMEAALEDEDDYIVMRQEVNDEFVAMLVSDGIRSQAGQIKYEKNFTICKPLLSYSWNQGDYGEESMWNKYCKSNGKNVLAGCTIVAIAEIEAYLNYGSEVEINGQNVNVSNMYDYPLPFMRFYLDGKEYKELTFEEREQKEEQYTNFINNSLMENVSLYIGNVFTKTKKCWIGEHGTAATASAACRYLKNNTKNVTNVKVYKGNAFTEEMTEVISQMLSKKKPVFITACRKKLFQGHSWVIDGAKYASTGKYIDRYMLHCKWGWANDQDGYFSSTCFNPYLCDYFNSDYHEINDGQGDYYGGDYLDEIKKKEFTRHFRVISYDTVNKQYENLVNPITGQPIDPHYMYFFNNYLYTGGPLNNYTLKTKKQS